MAFVITEPCIKTKDTACVAVCPCDCIHPTREEAAFAESDMLYIDPGPCIDCGLCAAECPVSAVFHEDEVPPEWQSFIERNAAYYRPAADRC